MDRRQGGVAVGCRELREGEGGELLEDTNDWFTIHKRLNLQPSATSRKPMARAMMLYMCEPTERNIDWLTYVFMETNKYVCCVFVSIGKQ